MKTNELTEAIASIAPNRTEADHARARIEHNERMRRVRRLQSCRAKVAGWTPLEVTEYLAEHYATIADHYHGESAEQRRKIDDTNRELAALHMAGEPSFYERESAEQLAAALPALTTRTQDEHARAAARLATDLENA